jgi:LmbE family N-acetylglucosaminyl deacetylase
MRELELAQADIFRLGMPDGELDGREVELAKSLAQCIPEGAILVAPFEFDGHPDHDAVGRACRTAARTRGFTLVRYPIWAWHRGSPELLAERRRVRLMLDSRAREAKAAAISQFRSQIGERPGGAIVPAHVLNYFRRPYELFLL